jgi:anti-sigma factor RsiW
MNVMNSSPFSQVTDEMLSAYLDQEVSPEELALVEAAVAAEPDIAWRLESLRQTVQLLRALPAVALPRSFVLTEAQVATNRKLTAPPALQPTFHLRRRPEPQTPTWWELIQEQWRAFWQVGSPALRNAAAVSFVLFFVLMGGNILAPSYQPLINQQRDLSSAQAQAPANTAQSATNQVETNEEVQARTASSPSEAPVEQVALEQPQAEGAEASGESAIPLAGATDSSGSAEKGATAASSEASFETTSLPPAPPPPGEDQSQDLAPEQPGDVFAAARQSEPEVAMTGGEAGPPTEMVTTQEFELLSSDVSAVTALTLTVADTPARVAPEAQQQAPLTDTSGVSQAADNLPAATISLVNSNVRPITETSAGDGVQRADAPLGLEPSSRSTFPTLLRLAQLLSALAAVTFAGFWWRSRSKK